METIEKIVGFVGGLIGVVGGVLTIYAKYVDLRKRAARDREEAGPDDLPPPRPRARPTRPGRRPTAEVFAEELDDLDEPPPPRRRPRRPEPAAVARARQLVRAPAICLIVVGFLGVGLNLFYVVAMAVGMVGSSTRERPPAAGHAADPMLADKPVEGMYPAPAKRAAGNAAAPDDRAALVMGAVGFLSFAAAAGVAIWAGFNMLHLRSYWLSVAGSVAIMPGGCLCCLTGVPVGAWSLVVLFREDVSSAFR